jgi:hypothetical protein
MLSYPYQQCGFQVHTANLRRISSGRRIICDIFWHPSCFCLPGRFRARCSRCFTASWCLAAPLVPSSSAMHAVGRSVLYHRAVRTRVHTGCESAAAMLYLCCSACATLCGGPTNSPQGWVPWVLCGCGHACVLSRTLLRHCMLFFHCARSCNHASWLPGLRALCTARRDASAARASAFSTEHSIARGALRYLLYSAARKGSRGAAGLPARVVAASGVVHWCRASEPWRTNEWWVQANDGLDPNKWTGMQAAGSCICQLCRLLTAALPPWTAQPTVVSGWQPTPAG